MFTRTGDSIFDIVNQALLRKQNEKLPSIFVNGDILAVEYSFRVW